MNFHNLQMKKMKLSPITNFLLILQSTCILHHQYKQSEGCKLKASLWKIFSFCYTRKKCIYRVLQYEELCRNWVFKSFTHTTNGQIDHYLTKLLWKSHCSCIIFINESAPPIYKIIRIFLISYLKQLMGNYLKMLETRPLHHVSFYVLSHQRYIRTSSNPMLLPLHRVHQI